MTVFVVIADEDWTDAPCPHCESPVPCVTNDVKGIFSDWIKAEAFRIGHRAGNCWRIDEMEVR